MPELIVGAKVRVDPTKLDENIPVRYYRVCEHLTGEISEIKFDQVVVTFRDESRQFLPLRVAAIGVNPEAIVLDES